MSAATRAKKAQDLINEVSKMATPGIMNYHDAISEVRRIVIDILVLIRDDAIAEAQALDSARTPLP